MKIVTVALTLFFITSGAHAGLINFNVSGEEVSGFIQFNDDDFDGSSFQFVSNSFITDLMLTVFDQSFTLADVVTRDITLIDSSGGIPVIVNGSGFLADNGTESLLFPGNNRLKLFQSDRTAFPVYNVTSATLVPVSGTLGLFCMGAIFLVFSRSRAA